MSEHTTSTSSPLSLEDVQRIWGDIRTSGGRLAYIDRELERQGLLVERRETDNMSKSQLNTYKQSLKKESAARKALKKLTWQVYKANHIVHLGEDVFWNDEWDWDKFDHPQAEERAAENDLPTFDKPQQLAEALKVTIPQLRWMTFHRDDATHIHYERFTIPKRSGGERAIWAPRPILKGAQRYILREIVERLPIHGAAHGFVPGRSILSNAAIHTDSRIVIKMDLRNFFPTVTFPRVKGVFRKAGYREQIATLLALLCTEAPREVIDVDGTTHYVALGPRCLPQGAPTSPAITNTLCLELDRRLTGLAEKLGWRYTRYADDLAFSLPTSHKGHPRIGNLMGGVKMIIAEEGFTLHPDKTRIMRTGARQAVTGLIVNGQGKPRVPRETRRKLRAAINNQKHGKPLHENESLYTLLGYSAFVYMTDRQLGAQWIQDLKPLLDA